MRRTTLENEPLRGAGAGSARPGLRRGRIGLVGAWSREVRDLARRLGTFPAFSSCSREDLEALAKAGRVTSLPAYWTFLHEGTPADSCYVLLEGQARVLAGRLECALAGPGSVLGEVGLLNRSLRTATVVTDTPVLALRIEYDVLSALCHAHPQLGQSVQAVFGAHRAADSRRIRQSALAVQGLEA